MLALRRGVVRSASGEHEQQLTVALADGGVHPAIADFGLVGRCGVGDEVIVNVAARELGLGSGGFDVVHVNLTRGLEGARIRGAHVMKLNYTSLQHAVHPVEASTPPPPAPARGAEGEANEADVRLDAASPVAVIVASTFGASLAGTPDIGMPVLTYTLDRLIPATRSLTPRKMATWPSAAPT